ncbi:hypothetical protein TcWFU_004120 [Taenia crassiceps]|uniref:Uncharacterized protein n=1 Tax=Taenia crassiceps TaxID=6207 RepID=A0ABR4Q0H7_9CEST
MKGKGRLRHIKEARRRIIQSEGKKRPVPPKSHRAMPKGFAHRRNVVNGAAHMLQIRDWSERCKRRHTTTKSHVSVQPRERNLCTLPYKAERRPAGLNTGPL